MPGLGRLTLEVVETPSLGDRSYLVHDGSAAFVVDPQRDIDRVLELVDRHRVTVEAVLETHIHNDYVTGGLALAELLGAAYLVNAADDVSFLRTPVRDGETLTVGDRMRLTAVATPGHTFTHLSYLLSDDGGELGDDVAVFSGGSLLFGATGRPDLLGQEHTQELAHLQHRSARRLARLLPDAAEVLPTHGFGSFCAATQSEASESTIGQERRDNPALTQTEQEYVDGILAALDAWPAYYTHMGPINATGPTAPDLTLPGRADANALRRRLEAGEWVVDLRNRTAFAAGHLRGSFNFGLDGSFAPHLGWLIQWGTPVTLLGDAPEQVAEAQRELVRIGIDRPAAHATGSVQEWTEGEPKAFQTATFRDLAEARQQRQMSVLDVRRNLEHAEQHIDGAVHVPIHDVIDRIDEVPPGEVWVHCESGYRASIAGSILDAAGRQVVVVDDDFTAVEKSGLPVVSGG